MTAGQLNLSHGNRNGKIKQRTKSKNRLDESKRFGPVKSASPEGGKDFKVEGFVKEVDFKHFKQSLKDYGGCG